MLLGEIVSSCCCFFFVLCFLATQSTHATAVVVIVNVVAHAQIFLFDQLLGTLDLIQRHALRGATRLTNTFRMRFTLRFALLVANGWHKGSIGRNEHRLVKCN